MRHLTTTVALLSLLAAPALAIAQPAGSQGGNMGGNMGGPGMPGMAPAGQPGPSLGERQPMQGRYEGFSRERGMSERASAQDRRFVAEATSAGLAEVAAGRLALERASQPAVAEFGRWMVTGHGELNDTLEDDAHRAGIFVPRQMAEHQRDMLDGLRRYKGAEFDMHYLIDQVEGHKRALGLFEREAQYGENPMLRWFARHSHRILQQHLAEAQVLRSVPESSTARGVNVTSVPMAPMPDAQKARPNLQAGTTAAVRHELNKEGAKVIQKASP